MRGGVLVGGAAALAAAFAVAGCSAKNDNPDLVAGKKLFVQKCGSCHVLGRAATKGVTGPDLDEAFQQSVREDFGADAIRGVVHKQILYPARAGSGGETGAMPANLVTGDDADDVAAYVAKVVAQPGKDTGLLATAVSQQSSKPAVEKDGKVSIEADPNGQLLYLNKTATAKPGELTVEMPNKSGVQHDIVIDGKGEGKVVSNGTSSFKASFTPGKYEFFCSVPGHEQAGMKGTLTVK